MRKCYSCGSTSSKLGGFVSKSGRRWENWYLNKPTNLMLCQLCYARYIMREKQYANMRKRKDYYDLANRRKLHTNGQIFYLEDDFKTGICNWCRAVKPFDTSSTAWHHDEGRFDPLQPFKFCIEICKRCHGIETWRLGQVSDRLKPTWINNYNNVYSV